MAVNIVRKSKNEEEEEKRKQLLAQMQENSQARKNAEIQAVKNSNVKFNNPYVGGGTYLAGKYVAGLGEGTTNIVSAPMQTLALGFQQGSKQASKEQTTWDKIKNIGKNTFKTFAYADPTMITRLMYDTTVGRDEFIQNANEVNTQIQQNASQADSTWKKATAYLGGYGSFIQKQYLNSGLNQLQTSAQSVGQVLGSEKSQQASQALLQADDKLHEPIDKLNEELSKSEGAQNKVIRRLGNASYTIGNMTPSILISALSGGAGASDATREALSLTSMGISAKGGSTREGLKQGLDLSTAERIGVSKGMVEVGTEKMWNGLSFLKSPDSKVGSAIRTWIGKQVENRIKSQFGKTVLTKWIPDLAGESIEEFVSGIYDNWLDRATVDPNRGNFFKEQSLDTLIDTTLSTLLMNAPSYVLETKAIHDRNKSGNQTNVNAEESNGYKQNLQEMVNNLDIPNEMKAELQQTIDSNETITGEEYNNTRERIKSLVKANTQQQIDSLSNNLNNQYIDINNRLSELDNIKAENFKDPESRRFYAQQINKEFGDTTLDSILAGYPENRNGNRTVKQYKEIAKEYGKQMAENGLTFDEVRANTVGAWQYYEPNKNITRYDNQQKKNASFERLNSQVWSEEVYNSYKDTMRTQLQQQQEALSTQMNDELARLQDKENITLMTIDDLKPKASPEQVARTKKLIEDFAKARGVNVEYNAEVFKNNNEEGFIKDKGNGERTIYINPNADTDTILVKLATHEMFHDTIRTQPHDKLTQLVMDKLKADENYDMYRQSVVDAYLDELNKLENTDKEALTIDELTDKQNALIDEEMTAKYLGEYLGDEQFVQQLVNSTNRSTIQKIMDWIDNRLQQIKNVVTGNKEAEYWRKVRENFEKAYNSKYQGQEGTQYSIQTDNKGRTLTSEQEDYFKDSKVRDRDGNLITLYHGTDNEVTTFDTNKPTYARYGSGAYLTDGIGIASEFADIRAESNNGKAKIIEGYANIDKMFDNTTGLTENTPERQKLFELLKERGLSDRQLSNIESAEIDYPFQLMERYLVKDEVTNDPWIKANTVNKLLREAGYNGIKGYYGDGSYEYVTFNPNQIKDIENKKPTTNDDIRYSKKTAFDEALKQDNQGRTLTKEQQEYFKNSKVRDENGNLLEVYHGTKTNGINVFKYNPKNQTGTDYGKAFYFTTDYTKAQGYQYNVENDPAYIKYNEEYNKMKDYAFEEGISEEEKDRRIKELSNWFNNNSIYDIMNDENYTPERMPSGETKKLYLNITNPYTADAKGKYYYEVYDKYFEEARKNNNDGIIVKNVIDVATGEHRPIDVYIAFNENQIKNVDNLKPTENLDIRYSKKTAFDKALQKDNQGNTINPGMQEYLEDVSSEELVDGKVPLVYHTTTDKGLPFMEFNPVGTPYYRFGDQVVNYYTDSQDMSSSYANGDYVKADTTKIDNLKQAREWLKENTDAEDNIDIKVAEGEDKKGKYALTHNGEQVMYFDDLRKTQEGVANYVHLFKDISKLKTEDTGYQRRQYQGYVKLTNPYVVDAEERNWNQVVSQSNDFIDELTETVSEDTINNLSRLYKESQEISADARAEYYKYDNIIQSINTPDIGFNEYTVDNDTQSMNHLLRRTSLNDILLLDSGDTNLGVNTWFSVADVLQQDGIIGEATAKNITDDFKLPEQVKNWIHNELYKEINVGLEDVHNLKELYEKKNEAYQKFDKYRYETSYFKEKIMADESEEGYVDLGELNNLLEQRAEVRGADVVADEIAQASSVGFSKPELIRLWGTSKTTNDIVKEVIASNQDGTTNYDGVIIKNVYDYGGKSENETRPANVYVTFNSNQFKAQDNMNPTEDPDIRYNKKSKAYDEYLKANNPNRSGVTIGDLKNLPTKQQKTTQPILPTQQSNIANDYIKFRELTEQVKNGDITEAEFDRLSNLDDIQQELKNLGKTDKQVQDIIFELGNLRDNQLNERDINNLINLMGMNAYDREVARNKIAKGETLLPTTNVQATTERTQTISSTIEEPTLKVPVPKGNTGTEQKVAKVLSEPITKVKPEQRAWALFKANILDKGAVFEDLSFKSKNRELQAKWDSTLFAEANGQNAIGHARYEFKDGKAIQISKSLTNIIDEVGENSEDFNNYMYHQLNIDRMTLEDRFDIANKPVFGDGIDANYSRQKVAELEKAHPEFKEYAQDVYDYLDTNKKELVNNGVISQETSDRFKEMYPHYVPIARIDTKGLAINVPLDTNRTGVNSPIKRAKGGSQDIQPLFQTMSNRTMQTYKASARNSFGLELKNTLDTLGMFNQTESKIEDIDTENLFEYDNEKGNLQEGTQYQNPTFTVFDNGEKVTYEINQDIYDALKPKNELLSKWDNTKLMQTTRKINDFRRGILTEYNPVFSLTNATKDSQDVLMNSQHAIKTYAKFPEAYSQILKKGYWYKEYVQNGGNQNSYFTDGDFVKPDSKVKSTLKMPLEAISRVNNVIEMAPRLAEYIASREEGKSVQSSMLDASRVTTNFKAGGDVTKFLNRNGATFLNASVQGLQQNIRNIREANAKGLKGYGVLLGKAVIAGLPALILNNLIWKDDDDYEELQDYVKDNYYIIAKIGDHKFLRIPKGRTVAVIQKAVTNMSDFMTNKNEIDPDKYSEVIWGDLKDTFELASNNLAPNNPIENNIISPIVQAVNNKTWYGEDLVPSRLKDKPNEEKYDESTAEISKQISGVLNKIGIKSNPMQINYLLDQYGGGVADVLLPMGTPQAENNVLEDKFTTDSVMKSRYPGEFFEQKDKLAVNRNSSKATDEDELLYKYANSVSGELSDLYQEKREIQNSSLTDKEKKKQIAEVQKQINSITEKALQDLKEPKIKDNTATLGNTEYIKTLNAKTGENEWKKLTDKTKIEGVSLKTQADYENRLAKYKQKTGDSQLSDKEETQIILDGNYTSQEKKAIYLSTTGKKDDLYRAVSNNMNIDEYLGYKTANIQGTKDSNGKTISGTKKQAQLDYINNNISGYENRLLLMGKDYKLSRSQQQDLSAYIDTLDNAEELYTMFDKNFTVKSSSSLGQYGKGNIDLYNRPIVTNSDGSISTVRSMSFEENGKEILIPTVVNGRVVSDDEAIDHYHRTGEYLGKFNSVKEADDYAEKLHEDQEKMYSSGGRTTGYTVYYK